MIASGPEGLRHEEVAQDLFEVVTQLGLAIPRGRRRPGDLKELEFLTLSILNDHGSMIVGDIQRWLHVLPAQMSRIIRALEDRERPLVMCRINPHDKRKIDVCLTPAGEKALLDYQTVRVHGIAEILRILPDEEQEDLKRMLDRLHDLFSRGLCAESSSQ